MYLAVLAVVVVCVQCPSEPLTCQPCLYCADSYCLNGYYSYDNSSNRTCECYDGYFGEHCEYDVCE